MRILGRMRGGVLFRCGALKARAIGASLGLLFCVFALPAGAQQTPDELQTLLSAPFAEGTIAAPVSDMIAWKETEQGRQSLWVATAPDFTARKLVSFDRDDGQALTGLTFDPAETYLYYVRGNGAGHHGWPANPASASLRPRRQLFRVALSGGDPEVVAEGGGPSFNPATGDLLFRQRGWLAKISSEDLAAGQFEPVPVLDVRGGVSDFSWAPDGSKAVFVADRGSHSFVGLFDPEEAQVSWLAPDVSRDIYPVWSPDSQRIAFLRAPGQLKGVYFDFSDAWDFGIWVHDVQTGETEHVWQAPGADGSRFEWWRTTPLLWAGNETLVFNAETDDWLRSYRLDLATGVATPLTRTGCEVISNTPSAADGIYIVSTNCGDIDRRHLTQFDVLRNTKLQLTFGEGIEVSPVRLASGKYLAYAATSAKLPRHLRVMDLRTGSKQTVSSAPDPAFAAIEQIAPQSVTFQATSSDDATIYGQVFKSEDPRFEGQARPAVIFLHGGPIRQMLAGWHTLDYYDRFYALNQYLARQGYVVLSVNYRSGIGYGRTYRTIAGLGPAGALEYADILGGAAYLTSLESVDPDRIGIYGASYGGFLTGLGLARDSEIFAAGVNIHGVHDWPWYAEQSYAKGYDDGWRIASEEEIRVAHESSPVADLETWVSPTLFIHGDDDRNVEFSQTVDLVTKLRERDQPVEVLVLADEVHGFMRHQTWSQLLGATAEFLGRNLGESEQ